MRPWNYWYHIRLDKFFDFGSILFCWKGPRPAVWRGGSSFFSRGPVQLEAGCSPWLAWWSSHGSFQTVQSPRSCLSTSLETLSVPFGPKFEFENSQNCFYVRVISPFQLKKCPLAVSGKVFLPTWKDQFWHREICLRRARWIKMCI